MKLINIACKEFGITPEQFLTGRHRPRARAREIVVGILLEGGITNEKVAQMTGLDRSCTYHWDFNFQKFMQIEADYQRSYERIVMELIK